MPDAVARLTLQFLEWLAARPRTYADVMAAWRTTCPRLSIWEDALREGFVQIEPGKPLDQSQVALTPRGRTTLADSAK